MPLVTSSGHAACAVASATPASRTRLAVLCHQGGGAASSSTPDGSSPPVHPCQGAARPGMRKPHGVRGAAQAPTGPPVASSLSLRPRLAPAPSAHTPRVLPGKIPSLPDSRLTVKPPRSLPSDSSSPRGPAPLPQRDDAQSSPHLGRCARAKRVSVSAGRSDRFPRPETALYCA